MKKFVCFAVLALCYGNFTHAQHAFIGQNLLDKLATAAANDVFPVALLLDDQVDIPALKRDMIARGTPVKERPRVVMQHLKSTAAGSQPALRAFIEAHGGLRSPIESFWINNCMAFSANVELIEALSSTPGVGYISLNEPFMGLIDPIKGEKPESKSLGGKEPGISAVGAPALWAMGYTGHGRIAFTFDSGVWPNHPAIADRFLYHYLPAAQTWFAYDSPTPADKLSSHGTHVTGTMLGLEAATNDTIGVAPRAYFIATDPLVGDLAFVKPLTDFMYAYEWSLNPDGDENTSDDVPDVINNSWGFGPDLDEAPCPEFVVPVMNALEAAGIANVASAGNEGPEPSTIGVPHNINTGLVNTFTVGAVDGNLAQNDYPIAEFSSRGPSVCGGEGSLLIKPEVSAPGVNVRSAVGSSGYDSFSGTSMAAPHVSGVVLLLKEAFPELSGEEILLAIYYSATDLGEPGEDNTYGMGLINAKAAFDYLALSHEPSPPVQEGIDVVLAEIVAPFEGFRCTPEDDPSVEFAVRLQNKGLEPLQTLFIEYRINQDPWMGLALNDLNLLSGAETTITLPAVELVTPGFKELHVRIAPLEGEYDVVNNNAVKRWEQLHTDESGSDFAENFDNGFEKWVPYTNNPQVNWDTLYTLQKDGSMGYAAWLPFLKYDNNDSSKDLLLGPALELPTHDVLLLAFDYFYRRQSGSPSGQDSLAVQLLTNCGEMVHELWKAGGAQLWTVPVNGFDAFPQNAEQWRTITIPFSLSDLEGADFENGIHIAFEGTNRKANNLLIDNIQLGQGLAVPQMHRAWRPSLVPNPAAYWVQVSWPGADAHASVDVYDLSGRLVQQHAAFANQGFFETNQLPTGLYIVKVALESGSAGMTKLVVH